MKNEELFEKTEAELVNAVYKAALLFEALEHKGLIVGNGHHAAQKIATEASNELRARWKWEDE
jgi:predicted ATPase